MKVCQLDRNRLYQVLHAVFESVNIKPAIAELGVLRGENAMNMFLALSPAKMVLIDSWNRSVNDAYSPFGTLPPWIDPVEEYSSYVGGPVQDQATWDALYEECMRKFEAFPNVSIIRSETIDAIKKIGPATGVDQFDLIYIDANHQYEYILRDLLYYQDLVAPDGFIMLNDCCFSHSGIRQNLGVLEALGSFTKRTSFIPVALTNTDWSDVILVRKGNLMERVLDQVITHADIGYVEIPPQLVTAGRIIYGHQRTNISFC